MSTVNENNITDVNDSTLLENTPMMVVEQGGQTLAIPITSKGGGVEQIQADWAQTDDTAVDFIKNKPEIPQNVSDLSDATDYAKVADVPTTVAELSDATEYARKSDIPEFELGEGVVAQQIFTDTTSTEAVISNMEANTRYVFTQPLTSLTIEAVENSNFESEVQFSTADSITVSLPDGLKFVGLRSFYPDSNFIMNVKNEIAVIEEYYE